MHDKLVISKYLSEVLTDWRESRADFPANTCRASHWPIPFFGNPATALVATVGVNHFVPLADRKLAGDERGAPALAISV
jgi:hypothetical protein